MSPEWNLGWKNPVFPTYNFFISLSISLIGLVLASASENVYKTSGYGQLVTSSTLRWHNTNNSRHVANVISLDGRAVCRGWFHNQLAPGNTDPSGKCQVGFSGDLHGLEDFQVLVDPTSTSRLEWRKWDIFTARPVGLVAFLDEDAFIARHFDKGRYSFGDLNPRRGLSGDIAIYYSDKKVEYFEEGDILVEIEPVKYALEDLDFVSRRIKVNKEEVNLGSRVLSNVIHSSDNDHLYRILYSWDSVRSVISYNATYNYYWGQYPGLIKALPTTSEPFSTSKKINFKWGLPLVFTRHRILEVSFVLQPGTSVQVSALAWRTTTEVPYSAKLISIYEDGKIKRKLINGTYLETILSEVETKYGQPYYTHNGTYAPTTTTTATTTTTMSTTTPTSGSVRRGMTTTHMILSTPRPKRTTTPIPTEPNPLLRFYPKIEEDTDEIVNAKTKKDQMQSDEAKNNNKRSSMSAAAAAAASSLVNSGNLHLKSNYEILFFLPTVFLLVTTIM